MRDTGIRIKFAENRAAACTGKELKSLLYKTYICQHKFLFFTDLRMRSKNSGVAVCKSLDSIDPLTNVPHYDPPRGPSSVLALDLWPLGQYGRLLRVLPSCPFPKQRVHSSPPALAKCLRPMRRR